METARISTGHMDIEYGDTYAKATYEGTESEVVWIARDAQVSHRALLHMMSRERGQSILVEMPVAQLKAMIRHLWPEEE